MKRARARLIPLPVIIFAILALSPLYFLKIKHEMADFNVCHTAGRRFLAGTPLYRTSDGHYQFKYPPFYAMLIAPLALLPLESARLVWFYLTGGCLLTILYLSSHLVFAGRKPPVWIVPVTFLIHAKFYGHELTLGQVNALMVLLLLLMVHFLAAGRTAIPGACLAVAAAIKPYGIIFLPYLLVRRKYAALLACLGFLAAFLVLPTLRYGPAGNGRLLQTWIHTLSLSTPQLYATQDNVSILGFFTKWLGQERPVTLHLCSFALMAALYAGLILAASRNRGVNPEPAVVEASVLLVFIPLFSPLGWDYTFLSSTLAVMIVLSRFAGLPPSHKALLTALFVAIGGAVYDLLGRELYSAYMQLSLLTPVYVILAAYLIRLRWVSTT